MKKLFTMIVFFMSSFFLFDFQVKAETVTYSVIESEFDYFTEDFYKIRDLAIANLDEEHSHYVILYDKSRSMLRAYLFDSTSVAKIQFVDSLGFRLYISGAYKNYRLVGNNLTDSGSGTSYYSTLCSKSGNTCTYLGILDTNFDLSYTSDSAFNISHNSLLYEISVGSHVPTLYEIYVDSSGISKNVITDFYTLCIEKIELLVNLFLDNSVFLTIFCIFIFIFIIEFVWRRFL